MQSIGPSNGFSALTVPSQCHPAAVRSSRSTRPEKRYSTLSVTGAWSPIATLAASAHGPTSGRPLRREFTPFRWGETGGSVGGGSVGGGSVGGGLGRRRLGGGNVGLVGVGRGIDRRRHDRDRRRHLGLRVDDGLGDVGRRFIGGPVLRRLVVPAPGRGLWRIGRRLGAEVVARLGVAGHLDECHPAGDGTREGDRRRPEDEDVRGPRTRGCGASSAARRCRPTGPARHPGRTGTTDAGRAREPQQATLVGARDAPQDDGEQPGRELLVDPVDLGVRGAAGGALVEVVGDLLLGAGAEVTADVLADPRLRPAARAARGSLEVLVEIGPLESLPGPMGQRRDRARLEVEEAGHLGGLAALDLEVPEDLLPRLRERRQRRHGDITVEVLDELLDRREYVVEQPRLVGGRRLGRGTQPVAVAVADGDLEVGAEVLGRPAAGLHLGQDPRERLGNELVGAVDADEDPRQPASGLDLVAVELSERLAVPRAGALEQPHVVGAVPGPGREIGHRVASLVGGHTCTPRWS